MLSGVCYYFKTECACALACVSVHCECVLVHIYLRSPYKESQNGGSGECVLGLFLYVNCVCYFAGF